jgi:hypothetical protein
VFSGFEVVRNKEDTGVLCAFNQELELACLGVRGPGRLGDGAGGKKRQTPADRLEHASGVRINSSEREIDQDVIDSDSLAYADSGVLNVRAVTNPPGGNAAQLRRAPVAGP